MFIGTKYESPSGPTGSRSLRRRPPHRAVTTACHSDERNAIEQLGLIVAHVSDLGSNFLYVNCAAVGLHHLAQLRRASHPVLELALLQDYWHAVMILSGAQCW